MASSQVPGTDHRNHLIILGGRALIFLHCLCDPVNSTRQKNKYSRICNPLSTGCIIHRVYCRVHGSREPANRLQEPNVHSVVKLSAALKHMAESFQYHVQLESRFHSCMPWKLVMVMQAVLSQRCAALLPSRLPNKQD